MTSEVSAGGYPGVPEQAIKDNYPSRNPTEFCNVTSKQSWLYENPSTCFEARDPKPGDSLETAVLFAEGLFKIDSLVYPEEGRSLSQALLNYDESVYPIPVGASIFFFAMIGWICTFYFTHLGRLALQEFIAKLDLFPEAHRFPDIPLYWLQQTKKEAELRREVRNTWAWLARRYLLSPDDPLLANVDDQVTWSDFELSRNTQSLITCVLKSNALFLKVKKIGAKREFELVKDSELTKVPMQGDQVRRIFVETVQSDTLEGDSAPNARRLQVNEERPQQPMGDEADGLKAKRNSRKSSDDPRRSGEGKRISFARTPSPPPETQRLGITAPVKALHASQIWQKKAHEHSGNQGSGPLPKSKAAKTTKPKSAKSDQPKAPQARPLPSPPSPAAPAAAHTKKTKTDKHKKKSHKAEDISKQLGREEGNQGKRSLKEEDIPSLMTPIEQELDQQEDVTRTELAWELPPLTPPIIEEPIPTPNDNDIREEPVPKVHKKNRE